MQIDTEKFYTPNEIVENFDLTTANYTDTKKQMLLRFIREGKLEAKNLGSELKPRYVVQGKNIIKFIKKYKVEN